MTETEAKQLEEIRRLERVNQRLVAHAQNVERRLSEALDQGARLAELLEATSRDGDAPAGVTK